MRKIKYAICISVFFIILLNVPIALSDQRSQEQLTSGHLPMREKSLLNFIPGEVLVKFKKETTSSRIHALHSKLRAHELRRLEHIKVRRIKLPSDISVNEAIDHYESDPSVEYAEPNYILNFAAIPNDSAFSELWGLHNTGQQVNGLTGTEDADIDVPEAWDITIGSANVVIAVIDSGLAHPHPEISPNVWLNSVESNGTEGVDDDNNGYVDDFYGWDFWNNDNSIEDYNSHGTHVTGTIAARGNNGTAITGVNWVVQIMALRIGGIVGTVGDATEAIEYAVDNGADIINASWGGPNYSQFLYDAISYANDNGVLFITAAGNGGSDGIGDNIDQSPGYPASYDLNNIITVAATDQNDNLTSFSNYGPDSVDVAAPGENIYSTIPEFTSGTKVILYTEDFDPPPAGWVGGGTNFSWGFVTGTGDGGTNSLEDSPGGNYLNNTSSLVGFAGAGTPFSPVKDNYYTLSFRMNAEIENGYDFLFLAGSENGTNWFLPDIALFYLGNLRTGSTNGFISDSFDLTAMADVLSNFYFGFFLESDSSVTQDGVYIDNLELYREPIIVNNYSYTYNKGTSMASPHVAGVAGLVKAQNPNYTHLQVRDSILNSVDDLAGLSGKISTGGRINAFKAVTYIAPPADFSVTALDSSVMLSWIANSESAVTKYVVSYGETEALGNDIHVGNVTEYEISGLTNEITYYFAVYAIGDFPVVGLLDGAISDILAATPTRMLVDNDNDGVDDILDNCPDTFNPNQEDSDEDGIGDACDGCSNDPNKTAPGVCGCGISDTDTDLDGTPNCNDNCVNDPTKTDPGICGCGVLDIDTDNDGTLDCLDLCPADSSKTDPGICGCGISDIDTDLDGTPNCNDNCPEDINKTLPGICGCGITDQDNDSDGIPDCNDDCDNSVDSDGDGVGDCDDLCPDDSNKTQPGTCGCSINDSDSDNDGTLDCLDTDDDGDGLFDGEEQGPNLNNQNYDGNGDGIPDRLQANVASFYTYDDQNYLTMESAAGTKITNFRSLDNPSPITAPKDVNFSFGFFKFEIEGVGLGNTSKVTFYFTAEEKIDTYYKFGPTPNDQSNHWYKFLYDGQTGAEIVGKTITLYFVDGGKGDDDLSANGTISDIGGPGVFINTGSIESSSSGSGGGGCFIDSSLFRSHWQPKLLNLFIE